MSPWPAEDEAIAAARRWEASWALTEEVDEDRCSDCGDELGQGDADRCADCEAEHEDVHGPPPSRWSPVGSHRPPWSRPCPWGHVTAYDDARGHHCVNCGAEL